MRELTTRRLLEARTPGFLVSMTQKNLNRYSGAVREWSGWLFGCDELRVGVLAPCLRKRASIRKTKPES